ncbi:Type 1 phosphatases regulator ypi1 [Microsporum canis]
MVRTPAQNAMGTATNTQTTTHEGGVIPLTGTLRLRGEEEEQSSQPPAQERHIKWAEDVVDNEGQGKKRSKVCCIYHKPRPAGESSSESESSDSDFDDDSSDDEGRSDKAHPQKGRGCSSHGDPQARHKRKPRPNAYERIPKNNT